MVRIPPLDLVPESESLIVGVGTRLLDWVGGTRMGWPPCVVRCSLS